MKFFRSLLQLSVLVALFIGVVSPAIGYAAESANKEACVALNAISPDDCKGDGKKAINKIVATVIRIMSAIGGIIAVIMIIIGGLKYVTSAGDSNAAAGAKNTIIYSVIGLVIVVFAQLLVIFVLDTVA